MHATPSIAVAIPAAGDGAAGVVMASQRIARSPLRTSSMISRAAKRTNAERPSLDLAPPLEQRLQRLACSIGCRYPCLSGGRSLRPIASRTSLVRLIRRGCTQPFFQQARTSPDQRQREGRRSIISAASDGYINRTGSATYSIVADGTVHQVLLHGGSSWSQVDLTADVTATLHLANGGLGLTGSQSGVVPYFSSGGAH